MPDDRPLPRGLGNGAPKARANPNANITPVSFNY